MILPDGTTAEVIQLVNDSGTIRATIQIVSPDKRETIAWLTVAPLVDVRCGQLEDAGDILAAKTTG